MSNKIKTICDDLGLHKFSPEIKKLYEKLELHELSSDLLKSMKFVGLLYRAGYWLHRKRIRNFLLSFDKKILTSSSKDKEKFEKYIESDIGLELWGEFIDATLNTSSKIVHAAFAILCADSENNYSLNFKRAACLSLKGLSDNLVNIFILLMEVKEEAPSKEKYTIRCINSSTFKRYKELSNIVENSENLAIFINELINKGLLLRDMASRFGSVGIDYSYYYGITSLSKQLTELLCNAKELLDK